MKRNEFRVFGTNPRRTAAMASSAMDGGSWLRCSGCGAPPVVKEVGGAQLGQGRLAPWLRERERRARELVVRRRGEDVFWNENYEGIELVFIG